jgi:nucleotide-binding universal stress UspA family protein
MEFQKILVPVTGTEADMEALKLAIRLARKEKGKIWSVYVITIKRALPLDAEIKTEIEKAEGIMDNIEILTEEEEEYEVDTDIIQARDAGPAIIDEAVERGVDLILMGVKYQKRFGQFSLGSVVPYILKNSPCPVILCHL